MKNCMNKAAVFLIAFVSIAVYFSGSAFAAIPLNPSIDFTGQFDYCDGTRKGEAWCSAGGGPSNSEPANYSLTFSHNDGGIIYGLDIYQGKYTDGTAIASDPILDSAIFISTFNSDDSSLPFTELYNGPSSGGGNLKFGPTQGAGTTGPVTFEIKDGSETYLSATIDFFDVTQNMFGTKLNPAYELDNILNITFFHFDSGIADPLYSQYIDELKQRYDDGWDVNFFADFQSFFDGSGTPIAQKDFTVDATGQIQGKLAVVPEPVSSVLFITGAATLALRRYRKKRK